MFSLVTSGAVIGASSHLMQVETDLSSGLPGFSMVGFVSEQVKEAGDRVRVSLRNCGYTLPTGKITVNIAPADLPKRGMVIDLPVAAGILCCMGELEQISLDGVLILGELGLGGEVRPVRGVLPIVEEAVRCGFRTCLLPQGNVLEGAVAGGIRCVGIRDLPEMISYLKADPEEQARRWPDREIDVEQLLETADDAPPADFAAVHGQEGVKRAMEIAAAGFHNLLMVGPPGSGKSMMAKCLAGILPPLSREEALEVSRIYSIAGRLPEGEPLITRRPFQAPHHSVTVKAFSGGGAVPVPGIISLAHRGVLFLDEMPEFEKDALNILRQPMEDRRIVISRASGSVTFPAGFLLVGAANPCPCGYYPDRNRCRCTQVEIERYQKRIPGPVIDRIDLCVDVPCVPLDSILGEAKGESSAQIRGRILEARLRQKHRFAGTGTEFNADMTNAQVEQYCHLGGPVKKLMKQIYEGLGLGARGYTRMLKTARTIADLAGSADIQEQHLAEAAGYRFGGQ